MSLYRYGEIVIVPFPYTVRGEYKRRPAVVVSSDQFPHKYGDVFLLAITSQIAGADTKSMVVDWQKAGLPKTSCFKPLIASLHETEILGSIGALSGNDCKTLNQLLKELLNIS